MGLRMNIPLPGPFSVSVGSGSKRRTVWTHGNCHIKHPTAEAANEHHARLLARTPAQVRRANIASAAMTLDTYADLFDDDLDGVATALDAAVTAIRLGA